MAFIPRMEINGVIDTGKSVLRNIEEMSDNSLVWTTWDPRLGKWRVVLNNTSVPTRTITEREIVGSVNLSGSGVDEIYNSVSVTFPNEELNGNKDQIVLNIDPNERTEKELDNQLNLTYKLCNNQIQAQFLGSIELKQSRLNDIIEFSVDYANIDLEPGEIFRLTLDQFDWFEERFRVITVEEIDGEEGEILLSVTALEYDGTVYSDEGFTRKERNRNTGIVPADTNLCILEKDDEQLGRDIGDAINTDAGRSAITGAGLPILETSSITFSTQECLDVFGPGTGTNGELQVQNDLAQYDLGNGFYSYNIINEVNALKATFVTGNTIKLLELGYTGPQGNISYNINGNTDTMNAGVPNQTFLFFQTVQGSNWQLVDFRYMEWSGYVTNFAVSQIGVAPVYWLVVSGPLVTLDLSEANGINDDSNIVNIDSVNSIFAAADGSGADLTLKVFAT